MTTKRVAGYVRLSKETEDTTSPERQRQAIRRLCRDRDWTLAETFEDIDVSAYNGRHRPGLERLMSRLAAIFGIVALLLAMVGLFGMVSYGVASRRSEIGVRVALGATRQLVLRLILRDVGRVVTIGLLAGAVIGWFTARVIRSLLYEIEPDDATTMGLAIAVLSLAAFIAAAWPARQAAGIHPVSVLRE